jgi:hypothetical protein
MDILSLVQMILSNRMTLFVLTLLIANLVTGLLVAILPHTGETDGARSGLRDRRGMRAGARLLRDGRV